jgi:hypothetical protein
MKNLRSFCLFFAGLVFGSIGFSQVPGFSVGQPMLDGNGCPVGSAQAVALEDGSTVSILFDQFYAKGNKGGNQWDLMRRFCRFRIPVTVPAGYNLEATSINYRGFADLPKNARGIVMTTGPMSNPMGLTVGDIDIRSEIRNTTGNFSIIQPLPQNFKNICRPVQMIEFNTVIQLFGPAPKGPLYLLADAQFVIDSGDIGGTEDPIRIKFRVRPCH